MPDFKKMTVESLRELARKLIGPGHSRLKTKQELVAALEDAKAPAAKQSKPAPAGGRAAKAAGKVARAAKAVAEKATGRSRKAEADEATGGSKKAAVSARTKKAAAVGAAVGARAASTPARSRGGRIASAAAAVAGAAVGAAVGAAAGIRGPRKKAKPAAEETEVEADTEIAGGTEDAAAGVVAGKKTVRGGHGPDPEGYFVARVRGEKALRDAPHPLGEADADEGAQYAEGTPADAPLYDERLGDLPWGYGDDAFVALPRDPRTLFLYWDHARETLQSTLGGLDQPRAQLWVFAGTADGWERIRVLDFAFEARGYYLHDLEPGRRYRAEIHVVDRQGRERQVAPGSNAVVLPPVGPSPIVDDRFIRIPWEVPLGRLLGPGHVGGPFSDEARAILARLSDWSRFSGRDVWGGSAGGMGGRPSSPTAAPSSPSGPPSSPGGPFRSGDA